MSALCNPCASSQAADCATCATQLCVSHLQQHGRVLGSGQHPEVACTQSRGAWQVQHGAQGGALSASGHGALRIHHSRSSGLPWTSRSAGLPHSGARSRARPRPPWSVASGWLIGPRISGVASLAEPGLHALARSAAGRPLVSLASRTAAVGAQRTIRQLKGALAGECPMRTMWG